MSLIDPEMERIGLEMSAESGRQLRKIMLDAGITSEEIKKAADWARDNTYINGVPISAITCEHCEGRGWIREPISR